MDEHNITQTTKKDQVFIQRWVTGSTIARWSEYAELNWKLSEKVSVWTSVKNTCPTKARLIWLENEN